MNQAVRLVERIAEAAFEVTELEQLQIRELHRAERLFAVDVDDDRGGPIDDHQIAR